MNSRKGSTFLLLIVVAGAITYFWHGGQIPFFNKEKSFDLNILPTDLSSFTQKTSQAIKDIKNKGGDVFKEVIKTAAEKPKEIITNVVSDAKKGAVDSFKNQIAETLGITTAGDLRVPKNIAIVRPVSQGLSLLIGSDESGLKYSINWGDGVIVSGSLEIKQQKTLDHDWKQAGEYSVVVETENIKDGQKNNFTFPVRILK